MTKLSKARVPYGRVDIPGKEPRTIKVRGQEYLVENPKEPSPGRVNPPELPIVGNPTVAIGGGGAGGGGTGAGFGSVSSGGWGGAGTPERPEVDLRQALRRCFRNGISQDRIQEIVDLETAKHIMDA